MKRPKLTTQDPLYNYMQKVASKLACPLKNSLIKIPEEKGSGFIKCFHIEEGLCIGYYHICMESDLQFNGQSNMGSSSQLIFKLILRLNNTGSNLSAYPAFAGNSATENSRTLYSTAAEWHGFIPKKKWYTAIGLIFRKDWLKENFSEAADKIEERIQMLTARHMPTSIHSPMTDIHYRIADCLRIEMCKLTFAPIRIKTKSLMIVDDFLNDMIASTKVKATSQHSLYYPEMQKVELRLSNFYNKPFPNLRQLCKEFNMSAATLKRHFKIVYGKSIRQYYLEKKLALGKEMIERQNKSVSEIAYMLGYNKINSFSKVFKKYYGILPREINVA